MTAPSKRLSKEQRQERVEAALMRFYARDEKNRLREIQDAKEARLGAPRRLKKPPVKPV